MFNSTDSTGFLLQQCTGKFNVGLLSMEMEDSL